MKSKEPSVSNRKALVLIQIQDATTLILNLCSGSTFRSPCHNNRYISTPREVVISPRSRISFHPNQSRRIITTCAFASMSFPLTKTCVRSINFSGSTMTLVFTVLRVFTTLVSGNIRCICSPNESVLHIVNVQGSVDLLIGLEVSIRILPFRFSAPAIQ